MTFFHWLGAEAEQHHDIAPVGDWMISWGPVVKLKQEDDGFITVRGLKNFQDFK